MDIKNKPLLHISQMIRKAYSKSLEDTLERHELSQNEGRVLLFLYHQKMNTAKEISNHQTISKSLISKSIDSLSKRRLIDIVEDHEDKRINRLFLSTRSKEILDELILDEKNFYKVIAKNLTNEEIQVMDQVLKKLHQNVTDILNGKV